ncbi:MAG: SPOR domain-containing protein [Alphaproteobacteria bacterium]|nr:SPOR domain-containing protein [Alphaproteobacteria bacterium]
MNDDNNLDLLDLDDNGSMDTLPDATPFASPRPKKPWLLLGVGVVVIILATYIIVRAISDESSSSIEVDLDAPVQVVDEAGVPVDMNVMPPAQPVQVAPQPVVQPAPQPVVQPQPVIQPQPVAVQQTAGVPVRVIEERKEVTFKPAAQAQPAAKPKAVPAKPKAPAAKPKAVQTAKPAVKTTPAAAKPVAGAWYVQFGSYSTRALAESAQRQIANAHKSLFQGKQFVILAAQLKDGKTTYRLRVAFKTASDANGFCRNAKSDGLDCYVAK